MLRTLVSWGMLMTVVSRAARTSFASLFLAFLISVAASGANAQPNDAFANAIDLPLATVLTGTNAGATKEPGEPDHGGDDGGGSVWWKFTAPVSKRFTVDLAGSDFAAIAGVYTGSAVNALTVVAQQGSLTALPRMSFNATAGTTYYIAVDGYKVSDNPHATGNITIKINRVLIVTPEGAQVMIGPEGGPFSPTSVSYTLTAPAGPINISVSNPAPWADEDEDEIIGLSTSPVTITFTLNASADTLTPGSHQATLQFLSSAGGSELRTIALGVQSNTNRTISLSASPAAGGTVAGGGTFANGSSRTVTATAAAAYLFTNWTEGAATVSTASSYTFTLNSDRTLVAHFALKRTLAVSANPAAGGTVTGGGTFAHGSSRTVTATPTAGYKFLSWTEGANQVASTPNYTFTLTANRTLKANFRLENDLLVDFGTNGLFQRMNNSAWLKVHSASPVFIGTGDLDNTGKDEAIASFSTGLWARYNNTSWVKLHSAVPARFATGNVDGASGDDLIADFGSSGIWIRYNNATWTKLHAGTSQGLATGDFDGSGKVDVLIDFGSAGLYERLNNASWVKLHAASPVQIAVGDVDGNNQDDAIIDVGGTGGIWIRYNNTTWIKLHTWLSQSLTTGDLDGNGKDEILIDFGPNGLWIRYNNATWTKLHATSPVNIATADLDSNGKDEAVIDFGGSTGLYVRYNNATWTKLSTLPTQAIAAGGFD